jgi:hypothetical protein
MKLFNQHNDLDSLMTKPKPTHYAHVITGTLMIFSSQQKAETYLAKALGKNPETFKPTKAKIILGDLIYIYPLGHSIIRKAIL